MAAPPARAQAYYDYDYLIRLLPIGDSDGCAKCERVNEFNHWTAHGGVTCVTFMLFESLCPCLH
ncbi:hypothetical protein GQ55_2G324300 [Panicum hallii var. hallii]|uniref:Uncharacterized protein n=1 Tax=Panicum hallii var. hallii TaxID=1504633 RepID=A0A2T7EUS5_9POAL|nr:hypothetical protein GQ55_2G324300 [Panicum hallii var. hallii]